MTSILLLLMFNKKNYTPFGVRLNLTTACHPISIINLRNHSTDISAGDRPWLLAEVRLH